MSLCKFRDVFLCEDVDTIMKCDEHVLSKALCGPFEFTLFFIVINLIQELFTTNIIIHHVLLIVLQYFSTNSPILNP